MRQRWKMSGGEVEGRNPRGHHAFAKVVGRRGSVGDGRICGRGVEGKLVLVEVSGEEGVGGVGSGILQLGY